MAKTGKKILLGILAIVLIAVALLLIKWCSARKSDPYATFIMPRLELAAFEVSHISKAQTDMMMLMEINNPSPFGVRIDSFEYKFFIEGTEVMHSSYPKSVDVDALDSNTILLPVKINNQDLINTLKKYKNMSVDSVHYRMESDMYFNLPFMKNKPQHFVVERYLPLFILPEIKITDFKIDELRMNESFVTTTLSIKNENNFAFTFYDIYYKFSLKDETISFGSIQDTIDIAAHETTYVTLPLKVKLGEAISNAPALLFNKANTEYNFYCDLNLVADNRSIRNSKVVIESTGMVKEITDLRK